MARGINRTQNLGSAGYVGTTTQEAPWDFLYDVTSTRNALYNLGDRVVLPDGREFRYGYSGAACYAGQACMFYNGTAVSYTTLAAAQAIGDRSIQIASQTFTLDQLRGGYVIIYGSTNADVQFRGIIGNTAVSSATVTIYLDVALVAAVTTSTGVEVCYNPWSDLRTVGATNYCSAAGVAAANVTASGSYFWVQTKGPCWLAPGEAAVGDDANERSVVFDTSVGALHEEGDATFGNAAQHAGYIIQRDSSGSGGPPFIMLQL